VGIDVIEDPRRQIPYEADLRRAPAAYYEREDPRLLPPMAGPTRYFTAGGEEITAVRRGDAYYEPLPLRRTALYPGEELGPPGRRLISTAGMGGPLSAAAGVYTAEDLQRGRQLGGGPVYAEDMVRTRVALPPQYGDEVVAAPRRHQLQGGGAIYLDELPVRGVRMPGALGGAGMAVSGGGLTYESVAGGGVRPMVPMGYYEDVRGAAARPVGVAGGQVLGYAGDEQQQQSLRGVRRDRSRSVERRGGGGGHLDSGEPSRDDRQSAEY